MVKKGRPREFDVEQALDAAMPVFWEKGYDGATIADLASAMALRSGSIYAAFGSKEGLFEQVLDRYGETVFVYGPRAIAAPTAREVVERFLHGAVDATTRRNRPKGCLLVQGALATGDEGGGARSSAQTRRRGGVVMVAERFQRALDEGDLPEGTDPQAAAEYVVALSQGIAVEASSGASRQRLRAMADLALRRLPWE